MDPPLCNSGLIGMFVTTSTTGCGVLLWYYVGMTFPYSFLRPSKYLTPCTPKSLNPTAPGWLHSLPVAPVSVRFSPSPRQRAHVAPPTQPSGRALTYCSISPQPYLETKYLEPYTLQFRIEVEGVRGCKQLGCRTQLETTGTDTGPFTSSTRCNQLALCAFHPP